MIPINIAIIGAGARSGSKARGFALGAVYGLAIALVYGAGGAAVAYTGSTFGTLNASPWFNGVVAVIFLLLALAMFDVFHIDFSKFSSGLGMQKLRRGSFGLAMFMGAVAALLAGACVAPVVIAVIVFAAKEYAEGNTLALLLPFVLGLGMALPWPFAGMGLAVLPKPGAWMEKVRYVFAAFVLVLALYYGHLTFSLFRGQKTVPDAAAMVEDGWLHSLPEALRTAREQNKPVLVDFWATWCKNCMFMDRTTLVDPEVQAELRNFVLLKYQAENPNAPATAEVMNYFDVLGLPTYLILQPRMGGRQEEP